ncbi:MAG: aminomethyl-transferring glycine dehydrogenase subunit GcvPB [Bryobacterales bacterium]|nr:aminomethyl-transferring glycine dehydrogenase subunit GcvPB [Bryobacterales bacterium]
MVSKVTPHLSQNEPLLFERSSPGKKGYQLPPLDVPSVDPAGALGAGNVRGELKGFPEVSEVETIRHFTRLSTWNYAIDLGLYPLGSCTMKYNPRVNEAAARVEGLAWGHPYQPESLAQGAMEIMAVLERYLAEITGMDAVTLQPAAGAHGEFTGILLMRACLESRGDARSAILVPDSSHGTNPATARMCGYEVVNVKSTSRGLVDMEHFRSLLNPSVAGIMITNPNTLGLFEENISEITRLLHDNGSLVYMDGANMNALAGVSRPGDFGIDVMHLNLHKTFSTPHGGGGPGAGPVAVKRVLEPYLPTPRIVLKDGTYRYDDNLPESIGKVRAFYGNFGVFVRALAYILAHGSDLRNATMDALLNANYLRAGIEPYYDLPYKDRSLHEVVFSDAIQTKLGVKTGDIAKRLIDYGFHPYTTSFPLIVPGAMMIEPTETEGKQELDLFIDAMASIAKEAEENPDLVRNAPHSTRVKRVDEVTAARKPIVRWEAAANDQ